MEGEGAIGMTVYPQQDDAQCDQGVLYDAICVRPRQTHSLRVAIATVNHERFDDTDALITFTQGLPIGVVTADCVPILIYAPDVHGVAAVHAGWRGTLGGILDNVIDVLEGYGADTRNMRVAFGPSISEAMYEVDDDLALRFVESGYGHRISYPGYSIKPHIDLQGVNIDRLVLRGIPMENIAPCQLCTYSAVDEAGRPLLQSHRRSHGAPGRNLTYIELC